MKPLTWTAVTRQVSTLHLGIDLKGIQVLKLWDASTRIIHSLTGSLKLDKNFSFFWHINS